MERNKCKHRIRFLHSAERHDFIFPHRKHGNRQCQCLYIGPQGWNVKYHHVYDHGTRDDGSAASAPATARTQSTVYYDVVSSSRDCELASQLHCSGDGRNTRLRLEPGKRWWLTSARPYSSSHWGNFGNSNPERSFHVYHPGQ